MSGILISSILVLILTVIGVIVYFSMNKNTSSPITKSETSNDSDNLIITSYMSIPIYKNYNIDDNKNIYYCTKDSNILYKNDKSITMNISVPIFSLNITISPNGNNLYYFSYANMFNDGANIIYKITNPGSTNQQNTNINLKQVIPNLVNNDTVEFQSLLADNNGIYIMFATSKKYLIYINLNNMTNIIQLLDNDIYTRCMTIDNSGKTIYTLNSDNSIYIIPTSSRNSTTILSSTKIPYYYYDNFISLDIDSSNNLYICSYEQNLIQIKNIGKSNQTVTILCNLNLFSFNYRPQAIKLNKTTNNLYFLNLNGLVQINITNYIPVYDQIMNKYVPLLLDIINIIANQYKSTMTPVELNNIVNSNMPQIIQIFINIMEDSILGFNSNILKFSSTGQFDVTTINSIFLTNYSKTEILQNITNIIPTFATLQDKLSAIKTIINKSIFLI
jgi:hypothetical protein